MISFKFNKDVNIKIFVVDRDIWGWDTEKWLFDRGVILEKGVTIYFGSWKTEVNIFRSRWFGKKMRRVNIFLPFHLWNENNLKVIGRNIV